MAAIRSGFGWALLGEQHLALMTCSDAGKQAQLAYLVLLALCRLLCALSRITSRAQLTLIIEKDAWALKGILEALLML